MLLIRKRKNISIARWILLATRADINKHGGGTIKIQISRFTKLHPLKTITLLCGKERKKEKKKGKQSKKGDQRASDDITQCREGMKPGSSVGIDGRGLKNRTVGFMVEVSTVKKSWPRKSLLLPSPSDRLTPVRLLSQRPRPRHPRQAAPPELTMGRGSRARGIKCSHTLAQSTRPRAHA